MAIDVTTLFANPDPNAAPTTLQQLVTILNTLVSSTIAETLTPYVKSSTTPLVEDQDKVWQRQDGAGRPLGTYIYYNGLWVREPPSQGAKLGYFSGDPTVLFDADGLGISGPGPVAYDYFGWQIANGNNGTANLSDQFIICGRMDNVGITGWGGATWRTNITGAPLFQGGAAEVTLADATTYRPARDAITVGKWSATGNTGASDEGLLGLPVGAGGSVDLADADAGVTSPDPISIVPPFLALALIAWVGYP